MQKFVRMMLLGLVLLIISACDSAVPAEVKETATPEVTPAVENVSLSGEYFLSLSGIADEYLPDNTPEVPAGKKWIVVTATINNTTGPTTTVADNSLYLVDDAGQRILAEKPDAAVMPPLVGAVIGSGEGVRGLARFAVPADFIPKKLVWCMDDACDQSLAIDTPEL
jgi:hypothetical protein